LISCSSSTASSTPATSEGDLGRVDRQALGARLAERHHLRAAALDLVHQEDPEADEDQERQHVRQQREDHAGARGLDVEVVDQVLLLGGAQLVDQHVAVRGRVADLVALAAAAQRDPHRVVLRRDDDVLDLLVLDLLEEGPERGRRRLVGAGDQLGCEERQDDHDQDREGGALEESAHEAARMPRAGLELLVKGIKATSGRWAPGQSGRPTYAFPNGRDGTPL
jgi:hypothetical protein